MNILSEMHIFLYGLPIIHFPSFWEPHPNFSWGRYNVSPSVSSCVLGGADFRGGHMPQIRPIIALHPCPSPCDWLGGRHLRQWDSILACAQPRKLLEREIIPNAVTESIEYTLWAANSDHRYFGSLESAWASVGLSWVPITANTGILIYYSESKLFEQVDNRLKFNKINLGSRLQGWKSPVCPGWLLGCW